MYLCEFCNYQTNVKGNFDKHLTSQKHLLFADNYSKKVKKINRQKTMASTKSLNEKNDIIKTMEDALNEKTQSIDRLKEHSRLLLNMLQLAVTKKKNDPISFIQRLSIKPTIELMSDPLYLEKLCEPQKNFVN